MTTTNDNSTGGDGMTAAERATWFADVRAMLNILESRPDVPLPPTLEIRYFGCIGASSDEEARARVGAAAGALALNAAFNSYGHYRAVYASGVASYSATAIPACEQVRFDEETRLGAEAYQALYGQGAAA